MYSKKRKRKPQLLRDVVVSRIRQARADKVIDLGTVRVTEWMPYFERTLPALKGSELHAAYRKLVRRGDAPHGDRYWLEYAFEAYAGHSESMILLRGLPDVAASRPHAARA